MTLETKGKTLLKKLLPKLEVDRREQHKSKTAVTEVLLPQLLGHPKQAPASLTDTVCSPSSEIGTDPELLV